MGGAGAKVTEVIAEWFSLRIRLYRKLSNSAFGARGRRSAAGLMKKPVRTFYWLFIPAASNSSPFCQPIRREELAASHPSANPKRAIAASPTKFISG